MNLNKLDTLKNIIDNLESNLNKSFIPHIDNIPNIEAKGIYFWFMKQSAYNALNKFVPVTSIEPTCTKTINGEKYDLVYLGTAGVRNNSNGINNGNLYKRLKWHLDLNKSTSSLCSGSMSTFRRTLGALISNDLINENTQDKIDKFIKNNFIIYYIGYPGTFAQVKDIVNNDESILINLIRPIFNLDKNPNALNSMNITNQIKKRRQLVENNSKKRWCNEKPKAKTKNMISKPIKLQNSNSKGTDYENCIEFQLARNQNIATIANGISNLHVGPCSIELFYKNSNDVRLYINNGKRNIRTKNRTISEYFNSPDTKNGNIPKWQIVLNEMNEPKRIIEEITVRVCSNGNTTESLNITINKKSSKNKKTNKKDNSTFNQKNEFTKLLNSLNLDKLKNDKRPKLLIIPCSKSKKVGGNNEFYSMFNLNPSRENSIHLYNDLLNNNPNYFENEKRVNINDVNSNYFNSAFNLNLCMRAIDRYDSGKSAFYSNYGLKNIYLQKINNNKLHLLIISGLYGLLNYEDFIPDYHFQMSKNPNWKNSLDFSIHNAVKEYINQNNIPDENVFYSLANNEYRKALKPNKNWKLLWLNNKSGSPKNSAKFIAQEFLPRL